MTGREYNNQFSDEELKNEIWKDIPDYEGLYQVSNLGRARSLGKDIFINSKIKGAYKKHKSGYLLSVNIHYRSKYCSIQLCINNKPKRFMLHSLILLTFVSERPKGMECCHIDDIKTNNRLDNLEWNYHIKNCEDRRINGKGSEGSKNARSKLSEQDVIEMRTMRKSNLYSCKDIALKFSVSEKYVSEVCNNRVWKHI